MRHPEGHAKICLQSINFGFQECLRHVGFRSDGAAFARYAEVLEEDARQLDEISQVVGKELITVFETDDALFIRGPWAVIDALIENGLATVLLDEDHDEWHPS